MNGTIVFLAIVTVTGVGYAEQPPTARIAAREFPSVFQAWNPATPLPGCDRDAMLTKHDLFFGAPSQLGLKTEGPHPGMSVVFTPASVVAAKVRRAELLEKNPDLLLLAEVRYRDAPKDFLPDNSPWWKRDQNGNYVMGWIEGGYRLLDVANPEWQAMVARCAKAVMDTGAFDGVMLDWWSDGEEHRGLIRAIREAIGPDALVLVNSNDRRIPNTADQINGLFMECYRSATPEDWERISDTLRWAETHLRKPRINCVETWFRQSRQDLPLMRAVTTLALTQSDGYCLFSDPNDLPTPDHLHDWYDFWNKGLGVPKQPGRQRADGAWEREFTNGIVVHNPAGNAGVTIYFPKPYRSRATGRTAAEHKVAANDGDIFLRE